MEFGRVSPRELNKINFRLKPDPEFNAKVLKGTRAKQPKLYMGCAKWGRKEWVGKIYPPKTSEKNFLEHYVRHYNSIELNATHYKLYDDEVIGNWDSKVGNRSFLFCPKMYQGITHRGSLLNKDYQLNEFIREVQGFGKHLGPTFIQLNDRFSPERSEELYEFLQSLPHDMNFFLEMRHPGWFSDKVVREELMTMLRKAKIGAVITDTAGRRDCAHMYLTVPKTFIRYVGNSLHATDYTRIDAWVRRIKSWLDKGVKEIYFFMHMHDEARSPELTIYLADKLNKACGLELIRPEFVG